MTTVTKDLHAIGSVQDPNSNNTTRPSRPATRSQVRTLGNMVEEPRQHPKPRLSCSSSSHLPEDEAFSQYTDSRCMKRFTIKGTGRTLYQAEVLQQLKDNKISMDDLVEVKVPLEGSDTETSNHGLQHEESPYPPSQLPLHTHNAEDEDDEPPYPSQPLFTHTMPKMKTPPYPSQPPLHTHNAEDEDVMPPLHTHNAEDEDDEPPYPSQPPPFTHDDDEEESRKPFQGSSLPPSDDEEGAESGAAALLDLNWEEDEDGKYIDVS
ncbi:hypothetical protein BU15DRAFT_75956 [Melanogaster broomeanus]|nr:hypothetical protein BU15DRAFT_75956 [Melanogaster broomeanus]